MPDCHLVIVLSYYLAIVLSRYRAIVLSCYRAFVLSWLSEHTQHYLSFPKYFLIKNDITLQFIFIHKL